ncbi:aminotransferase DegT [Orenia metallireducens]|uniref:Aminotransferase DegT n=1 Tax=Orenia metallireducens TaxID=1413210 RepID=A0A1C0AB77_9FIRM|nr:DegT/DnrJ/EryC1/StrS family aminotransferase [Orenia metallireducens]OCL27621.1 aminotransferase DegT [Orenia metallireducens]
MSEFIPIASSDLTGNELKYVQECIETNWISSKGRFVKEFEEGFAKYCNSKYGIATSNGTTALHLALESLGIGEGDEVIIPNLTFAATINAVLYTGAIPVLVDIDENSWNINVKKIEEGINNRTRAIIPVHLYGQPCDMDRLVEIANKYNLYIIEDCAEAHGAEYKGQKVGGFGDIACFSFYGNKIITTGEGGICLTNDKRLNEKMRILRDHGMNPKKRYWHKEIGYNYRMTNLQAAIGLAQLERIDELLIKRREIARKYDANLKEMKGIITQKSFKNRDKVCWLYSILIDPNNCSISRDRLIKELLNYNIDSRPFFYPLNKMDIYKKYGFDNNLEISEQISLQGINLPVLVEMNEEKINYISNIINKICCENLI